MILEVAIFDIKAGSQAAFEQVFPEAAAILARASGYVSHELHRCIETDTRFLLLVRWHSVAHHMEGFRQSSDFAAWRALLSPNFASLPHVEHYVLPAGSISAAR